MSNRSTDRALNQNSLLIAAKNVFRNFSWLPNVGLVLLYPLRRFSGDSFQLIRVISYITPWLLIIFFPILVTAIFKRRKWLSLATAGSILLIIFSFAPLFFPKHPTPPSSNGLAVKIMSYNLHGIENIDGILKVIHQEKPDILLLQEYSPAFASPTFHGLDDLYPVLYSELDSKGFGQAVYSRYPLTKIREEFDRGRAQKLLVETPEGSIKIWNIHPIPPFLVPPEEFDAQVSALAEDISQAKGRLIVAGDLNATDQSGAYRKIAQYLTDAYREAGWGFGFSYPAPPYTFMDSGLQVGPIWRIDHIFLSQEFIPINVYISKDAGGSDHFPIVAQLLMTK